jgi:hypothetical protein
VGLQVSFLFFVSSCATIVGVLAVGIFLLRALHERTIASIIRFLRHANGEVTSQDLRARFGTGAYVALMEMEDRGIVSAREVYVTSGDAPESGGRMRRFYRLRLHGES